MRAARERIVDVGRAGAAGVGDRRSSGWRAGAVVIGLLIAGGLAAVDAASGPRTIVIGTVVLAPFVVSVLAGPRETVLVGAAALALAILSGLWNHNFDTGAYVLRCTVVAIGTAISVLVAGSREQTLQDRERFELLAAVAEVADGRLTLQETATRLCELLVPRFADICVLDVVQDEGLRRLAVRACGADAAKRERNSSVGGCPAGASQASVRLSHLAGRS